MNLNNYTYNSKTVKNYSRQDVVKGTTETRMRVTNSAFRSIVCHRTPIISEKGSPKGT